MKNEETIKNETLLINRIIKEPLKDHVILLYNHFMRYNSALQKLDISQKDTVIDASCGYGYGTYILSRYAKQVFGLDINSEYLNNANDIFHSEKVTFYKYEEFNLLLDAAKVSKADKIVCIETFEHMIESEAQSFIKKILRYLVVGGDMLLTVPIGDNASSEYNKYHLFEPTIEYIYNLLGHTFKKIKFEIDTFENSFGYKTKYCIITLNYLEADSDEIKKRHK